MGRQIITAMSPESEAAFLAFLRSRAAIQLYRPRAATHVALEIASFPDRDPLNAIYLIWNTAFPWEPRLEPSEPGAHLHPWVRIANYTIGPVLEYTRSLHPSGKGPGRIYWPNVQPHPNPCAYDAEAFERWYKQIVAWIKQNSTAGTSEHGVTYFLRSPGGRDKGAGRWA